MPKQPWHEWDDMNLWAPVIQFGAMVGLHLVLLVVGVVILLVEMSIRNSGSPGFAEVWFWLFLGPYLYAERVGLHRALHPGLLFVANTLLYAALWMALLRTISPLFRKRRG